MKVESLTVRRWAGRQSIALSYQYFLAINHWNNYIMSMDLLTNSLRSTFQDCPRRFYYVSELGYKPKHESKHLSFGTAFHKCLEMYFRGKIQGEIVAYIESDECVLEPFAKAMLKAMAIGYVNTWERQDGDVEKEYKLPLVNPWTGGTSRTFELAGKIDAVVGNALIEHKTTSVDISDPTCDYWQKLALDSQVSGYFIGAESLGYKIDDIIYDVARKPKLAPKKATGDDKKKYKKNGELYANAREADETPEEYFQRLLVEIMDNKDKYFQRRQVPRVDTDLTEYMQDMWNIGQQIIFSRTQGYWPRRPSACFSVYGRCPFYGVCSKTDYIENTESFVRKEVNNEELNEVNNTKEGDNYGGF